MRFWLNLLPLMVVLSVPSSAVILSCDMVTSMLQHSYWFLFHIYLQLHLKLVL
jgi:hypothetical protein